ARLRLGARLHHERRRQGARRHHRHRHPGTGGRRAGARGAASRTRRRRGARGDRLGAARRRRPARVGPADRGRAAGIAIPEDERSWMSVAVDPYEGPVVLGDDPSLGPGVQIDYPGYRSTRWRVPKRPLQTLPEELMALDGPVFGESAIDELDNDLTRQHEGEPLGERITVSGRVLDEDGRPLRGTLVE